MIRPWKRNPAVAAGLVLASLAFGMKAFAETYELPRATKTMPVRALVECIDDSGDTGFCDIRHHCAQPVDWGEGIDVGDFSEQRQIEHGRLATFPQNGDRMESCVIYSTSSVNIVAYREHFSGNSLASRESVPIHRVDTTVNVHVNNRVGVVPVVA